MLKNNRALNLESLILSSANKKKAVILSNFFKTGKGQYGEGDVFLGISVPQQRKIALSFLDLSYSDLQKFLNSKYHEFRLIALLILVKKFKDSSESERKRVFDFYLKNLKNINNWDLVDLSSYNIVGAYLFDKNRKTLYDLAISKHLWSRRVAMVSTFYFIKNKDLNDVFKIAKILLNDKHDLMHKAVGWMLREAGKRDQVRLEKFLLDNQKKIARTTWRYAIERFSPEKRYYFMSL